MSWEIRALKHTQKSIKRGCICGASRTSAYTTYITKWRLTEKASKKTKTASKMKIIDNEQLFSIPRTKTPFGIYMSNVVSTTFSTGDF